MIYQGWMKCGIGGLWQPVCRDVTRKGCREILKKLKPEQIWSTSLVLPIPETPALSVFMHPKH